MPTADFYRRFMPRRRTIAWILALTGAFAFRLFFGLTSEFFDQDETQIFLLGLRFYATGGWPYFGPDVVWTDSEIPGALQALLVGLPLRIAPIPEAPFVLLNLLSMSALAALAWYICIRISSAPVWLVWGWLLTMPWTLEFSTHVNNPSYVMPAAIVFFIAFFEAVPALSRDVIGRGTAHFLMGVAIAWVMQIHLSWLLLVPYAFIAWLFDLRHGAGSLTRNALAFAAGALIPAVLLLPTLAQFGGAAGTGGALRNLQPHWVNPTTAVTTLARFFSFASPEIVRFVGPTTADRLLFFERHLWLAPLALVLWIAGIIQAVWMLREWFQPSSPHREWWALRALVAGTIVLVYITFWFAIGRATEAHAFYVLAPIAFIYLAYCWTFIDGPAWRRRALMILAVNIVYHSGLAWTQAPDRSLYKRREVVAAAIRLKQPEVLAHRRASALDGGPRVLRDPSRPYDPRRDIEIGGPTHSIGIRGLVLWRFTLRNLNPRAAFRDVLCETTYRNAKGETIAVQRTFIKDVFQPGESREVEVNDGFVRPAFASAALEVVAAEALLPASVGPD